MAATIRNTVLAYLLARQDFTAGLSSQQKNDLKIVVKNLQLENPEDDWQMSVEESLLSAIRGNSELDKCYQFYKTKLEELGELSPDLWPNSEEVKQLEQLEHPTAAHFVERRVPSDNAQLSDAEKQLLNVVYVTHRNEQPEEVVTQVSWLKRLRQKLS